MASDSIASIVERATSELLMMPDWDANMALVDAATADTSGGVAQDIAKALKKRLGHSNQKIVLLSVILSEALVKNGGSKMHAAFITKDIMNPLTAAAEGKKGREAQEKALSLIQLLAKGLEAEKHRYPLISAVYSDLDKRGFVFPPYDPSASILFQSPVRAPVPSTGDALFEDKLQTLTRQYDKLREDMQVVDAQIGVANTILVSGQAVGTNEAWLDVVDFLEQCRPRLLSIVTVGSTGSLQEDVFMKAIELSEALCTVLEGKSLPTDAREAAGGSAPGPSKEADLLGLGDPDERKSAEAPGVVAFSQPLIDAPLGVPIVSTRPAVPPPPLPSAKPPQPGPAPAPAADDFDDFIRQHDFGVAPAPGPAVATGSTVSATTQPKDFDSQLDDFFAMSSKP